MKLEYGYHQLSDPSHPLYNPQWYEICDIPKNDPWFEIVSQYNDAKFFAFRLERLGAIKNHKLVRQKRAESREKKDIVYVAGDGLLSFVQFVEHHLSRKILDEEFLLAWGEMRHELARLEIAYPDLVHRQISAAQGKQQSKPLQKQWYALWYKQRGELSRNDLDRKLEELCIKVMNEKVAPPAGWTKKTLRDFIADMAGEDRTKFKLSTGLGKTNLKKPALENFAKQGADNKDLPPVGFEYYQDDI